MGHRFQMRRIHASSIAAKVIPFKPLRWFASQKAVSLDSSDPIPKFPITTGQASDPYYAGITPARIGLRPKTLFGSKIGSHLRLILSGVMQRAVNAAPLLSIIDDHGSTGRAKYACMRVLQ